MKNQETKVCWCDGETPLLWTFKFPGAEYWCPRCGYVSGMFGAGKNVTETKELIESKKEWKRKANDYLSGKIDDWEYINN